MGGSGTWDKERPGGGGHCVGGRGGGRGRGDSGDVIVVLLHAHPDTLNDLEDG